VNSYGAAEGVRKSIAVVFAVVFEERSVEDGKGEPG